jgi:hypothetical protein
VMRSREPKGRRTRTEGGCSHVLNVTTHTYRDRLYIAESRFAFRISAKANEVSAEFLSFLICSTSE